MLYSLHSLMCTTSFLYHIHIYLVENGSVNNTKNCFFQTIHATTHMSVVPAFGNTDHMITANLLTKQTPREREHALVHRKQSLSLSARFAPFKSESESDTCKYDVRVARLAQHHHTTTLCNWVCVHGRMYTHDKAPNPVAHTKTTTHCQPPCLKRNQCTLLRVCWCLFTMSHVFRASLGAVATCLCID